jgi:hypothetical protein
VAGSYVYVAGYPGAALHAHPFNDAMAVQRILSAVLAAGGFVIAYTGVAVSEFLKARIRVGPADRRTAHFCRYFR